MKHEVSFRSGASRVLNVSDPVLAPNKVTERRHGVRQRMVFRVGVLDDGRRPAFCLVKNISSAGVQVKLFHPVALGSDVRLRVGDEDPLLGHVIWVRDQTAGIAFNTPLEPKRMLRVTQNLAPTRRRSSPRISAAARAILRTGSRRYPAELCDISASGARVRTPTEVILGPTVLLTLPGMPAIKSYPRWVAENEMGLTFEAPLSVQTISDWLHERLNVSVS